MALSFVAQALGEAKSRRRAYNRAMRRAHALTLVFVVGCKLHSLASAVSFEGEIDMSVSSPSAALGSTTLKIEMKGAKSRAEAGLAGFSMVTLTDGDAKKVRTLEPMTHTYTETDLDALARATRTSTAKVTARKTGRSDKVAGDDCDVYEIDDPSGMASHTEFCMASGLGMLALGLTGPFAMYGKDGTWGDVLSHGFPLRVVLRDARGATVATIEATRIDRHAVPDSTFEIPAGYTKKR